MYGSKSPRCRVIFVPVSPRNRGSRCILRNGDSLIRAVLMRCSKTAPVSHSRRISTVTDRVQAIQPHVCLSRLVHWRIGNIKTTWSPCLGRQQWRRLSKREKTKTRMTIGRYRRPTPAAHCRSTLLRHDIYPPTTCRSPSVFFVGEGEITRRRTCSRHESARHPRSK